MTRHNDSMETLLARLGQARAEGAIRPGSPRYPWKAASPVRRPTHRFGWVRVAVPLAAAAVVGVLFVGPSLMSPRQVREVAQNLPISLPSETRHAVVDAEPGAAADRSVVCDQNGDGVVDGRDIQPFMNSLNDRPEAPQLQVEFFQRCLLGS
jgi:hypothetical protein